VARSQSGQTEEIIETVSWARDCGARTLAITNGAGSPLTQAADVAFVTQAGAERAVPATKTFTTQLAALAVLAIGLGADLDPGQLREVPGAIEEMLANANANANANGNGNGNGNANGNGNGNAGSGAGAGAGAEASDFEQIVEDLAGVQGVIVSGRGLAYSAALELALKLKEACYLRAMGISYADLLHGPIAVVDASTPAIVVAANCGPTLDGTVDLARRVTGAGARAYAIGGGARLASASTRALPGPALPEWLAPIGLIVPGQLLTEALSRRLGLDPDSPRGLSKITQTG